jgi:SAM-dependent methyltransferase
MPGCSNCREFVQGHCRAYGKAKAMLGRSLPPPPLGACMIPIVEDYLGFINKGLRVLDIGCGSWDLIKNHCLTLEAGYEGIDVLTDYFGKKTVATRIENLAELSFPDEHFDLVIGNQTMEHWAEHGCSLHWGLYQCFRVCRPHGSILMNVPIHFHGTRPFMLGELGKLKRLFVPFSTQVTFHAWGSPSAPCPPVFPYPGYGVLRKKPAYILDIQAIKDRPLPAGYSNRGATCGRLAQLLNYPLSYNFYRVLRKTGFFSSSGNQDE